MPIFQQMIWKPYVLSLLYDINAQPLGLGERATTIMSTLAVPTVAICSFTREARGGDASCGDIAAEQGPSTLLYSRRSLCFQTFIVLVFLSSLQSSHYYTEGPNQGRLVKF